TPIPGNFDIAVNSSGAAIATWTEDRVTTLKIFAALFVPGQGWLASEPVAETGRPSDPALGIAANGAVCVEWRSGSDFDVVGNRFVHGVGWQGAEVMIDLGLGDPIVLRPFLDDAGDVVAFWVRQSVPPIV